MFNHLFFSLVLLASFSIVSAQINWQKGDKVVWALNCNFPGYDIGRITLKGIGALCGGSCISNPSCTHFTWTNNICYLKLMTTSTNEAQKNLPGGGVCGYVVNKTVTPMWKEEFNTLHLSRWSHMITGWRGGNNIQYYDNRPENSFVKNGILYIKPTLTADRFNEAFLTNGVLDLTKEGCNVNYDKDGTVKSGVDIINPIQSARILTEKSFSFTYGMVEMRAKMPKGDWMWPAIWMLPTISAYGEWPASGEIDITEVRGKAKLTCWRSANIGRQLTGSTLNWGPDSSQNKFSLTYLEKPTIFSAYFHVYQMYWTSNGFQFYVDGQQIGSMVPPAGGFWQLGGFSGRNIWASGSKMAPFDKPFFFVLNVAVGGDFFPDNCGNKPWLSSDSNQMKKFWRAKNSWYPTWNATTNENAMQVDYIRVYKAQ